VKVFQDGDRGFCAAITSNASPDLPHHTSRWSQAFSPQCLSCSAQPARKLNHHVAHVRQHLTKEPSSALRTSSPALRGSGSRFLPPKPRYTDLASEDSDDGCLLLEYVNERTVLRCLLSGDKNGLVAGPQTLARQTSSSARAVFRPTIPLSRSLGKRPHSRRSQEHNWYPRLEKSQYMRLRDRRQSLADSGMYCFMTSGFTYVSGQRASGSHPA